MQDKKPGRTLWQIYSAPAPPVLSYPCEARPWKLLPSVACLEQRWSTCGDLRYGHYLNFFAFCKKNQWLAWGQITESQHKGPSINDVGGGNLGWYGLGAISWDQIIFWLIWGPYHRYGGHITWLGFVRGPDHFLLLVRFNTSPRAIAGQSQGCPFQSTPYSLLLKTSRTLAYNYRY